MIEQDSLTNRDAAQTPPPKPKVVHHQVSPLFKDRLRAASDLRPPPVGVCCAHCWGSGREAVIKHLLTDEPPPE